MPPRISAIYLFSTAGASPIPVDSAELIASRGLIGDRYYEGTGSFSRWPGEGRDVTLVAVEDLNAIFAETGIDLRGGLHRRNLEVQDFRPADWLEKKFRIGDVVLRGARLCLPCRRLERLTEPGVYKAMRRRGGLRANVLAGGVLHLNQPLLAYSPPR